MRFEQIINEKLSPEEIFNKYFETDGLIKYSPDGIEASGNVFLKQELANSFTKLPIKFNRVGGNFAIKRALRLQSLNNFPRTMLNLSIFKTPIKKLISNTGDISCASLTLTDVPVANFADSSIVLTGESSVSFSDCSYLTSIADLRFKNIEQITIDNCPMFTYDLAKYPNIKEIIILGMSSNDMPLINGFISGKLKFARSATSETAKIYKKYQLQGPDQTMALIRELRAAGFKNAART